MAKVYEDFQELVQAVSKETGVRASDVRKVLAASFESTRAYLIRELKQSDVAGQSATGSDDAGQIMSMIDQMGACDS